MKVLVLLLIACCTSWGYALSDEATKAPFPFFALCMDTHDSMKRDLQQQALLLKELGYDGAGHLWLDKLPERIGTLDAAGLKLFQVYFRVNMKPGAAEPYDARLAESLALLKGRNTSLAVIMSGLPASDTSADARAVEIIRSIADKAAENDVRVALYPHVGDWIARTEDALRVAEKVDRPNVGVMFNLCHWLKVDGKDENLQPLLKKALPRLVAVTINGADTGVDIRAGKGNWIQPLGQGSFDVYGLLKMLRDIGYQGPVGVQCYGITGDAKTHLSQSITAWKSYMARLQGEKK